MNRVIGVALGGSAGALLRYYLQNWAMGRLGAAFSYGTMVVNISGGFFIGFLMAVFLHHVHISPLCRVFLVTGFLGGFTTFSAFTWEFYALLAKGQFLRSMLYAGGSLAGA